ncbi:hypothetical protein [Streptomyces antimycoticus]|uniref:hypothetical protein n=1 Tax=Streptomyces antimycoticus TaxID=68175 RepID=UPI0036E805C7
MPKRNAARKRAREIQDTEGIGYHDALNRAHAEAAAETATEEAPASGPAAVTYVLQPTAAEAEQGITAEELGIRALPADATPGQRAHAEAVWRPEADPARPCRCSGVECRHGKRCTEGYATESGDGADLQCTGRLIHADRHPGSLWGVTTWWDTYQCGECGEAFEGEAELPAIPWGENRPNSSGGSTTVVYDGVRHPNFPGIDADEDGVDEFELDPVHHPTPEDDWYDAYDEDEGPLAEEDQEDEPEHLDDGPEDDVESIGEPPEDYDDWPDENEPGPPSRVLIGDTDPQPTATDWP